MCVSHMSLEISRLPNATNIPLGQLVARFRIDSAEDMVLSAKLVLAHTRPGIAHQCRFKKVNNLKGGINALARKVDASYNPLGENSR
jgi:rhodanese-related sulfurtransferase